jgi:hypothetical protein
MSHHSDEEFPHPEILRLLKETANFRGAIGAFPEGKLTKGDEGSLRVSAGGDTRPEGGDSTRVRD